MEKSLIERLTGEYGCPLYVFDKAGLVADFQRLQAAFRACYPKYRIAYSYKTNYAPRICSIVRELGGLAEVVSDMELTIARKVGYPDGEILYNGPTKGPLMEDFLLKGGIVNIDNAEILAQINCLFREELLQPFQIQPIMEGMIQDIILHPVIPCRPKASVICNPVKLHVTKIQSFFNLYKF